MMLIKAFFKLRAHGLVDKDTENDRCDVLIIKKNNTYVPKRCAPSIKIFVLLISAYHCKNKYIRNNKLQRNGQNTESDSD